MQSQLRLTVLAIMLPPFAGCARTSVSTDVHPDGSWGRTVAFRGQAGDDKTGMTMGPKLEELFVIPSSAPGSVWKVKRSKQKDEIVITAERAVAKGETIRQDMVIRGKIKGVAGRLLVNEAIVREIAPGKLEYREVLHWQGDRPKDLDAALPEISKVFRESLPAGLATEADSRALSAQALKEFWKALFGPGDPMLSQILMHPELVERKFRVRMGGILDRAIQAKFGDRITREQRMGAIRKITAAAMAQSDTMNKAKAQAGPDKPGGGDDSGALVAMLFSVHMPGRIVATNGERDDAAGEVYWALYASAAALEDVVLTATCEVGK